jgi:putative RNA 2'-phosphotransferase
MNDKRRIHISKFISKHLRHEPDAIGLLLEPGGWVPIDDLLAAMTSAGVLVTREELEQVVAKCEKRRFAIDDANRRIRANQGHSTEVDLQLEEAEPPDELYHGTATRNLDSILRDGVHKMARHHVHLSPDIATARKVGSRHGTPAVLVIEAARMRGDGHVFFRSANGVWLVEQVPAEYLRLLAPETP